ncbi:hypothetical protein CJF32_00004341 [Rutstroemia sp. NJR-2017a WRK4]|nr:hypothetical protein CJF32_00004341 [Rutstroemia sp. NJR-2017a WRK4]
MAAKTCASYLRALRIQSNPSIKGNAITYSRRMFATASDKYANTPELNQTAGTAVPPVSPVPLKGKSDTTSPNVDIPAIAKGLRFIPGRFTETYTAYGVTEILYEDCSSQANYSIPQASDSEAEVPKTDDGEDLGVGTGWWFEELGLKPTFSTWSHVTMLHLYCLTVRFRGFGTVKQDLWEQHLVDHFFYDAEARMVNNHNMHARGTRNKYLKDMFQIWRGLLLAYDEGLAKGDAVLAAAVWRNLFKASEDVDIEALAKIVSWMRGTLHDLDKLTDEAITSGGHLVFSSPNFESELVSLKSRMMELPFDRAPGKDLPGSSRGR